MPIHKVRTHKGKLKPKRDATETLTFRVTRRDVSRSQTKEVMACALVMGCVKVKGVLSVKVGPFVAYVERRTFWERYAITPETRRKITAFDQTGYFEPGEYTFYPPSIKLGLATKNRNRKVTSGSRGPNVFRREPIRHIVKHIA